MRRMVPFGALVAAMVVAAGALGTGKALAYGGRSVAQVEVSGNCDNVSFCDASPLGGTGGLWIWASLNSDNTVDATFVGCGHQVGGGGSHAGFGGNGPAPVAGTWWTAPDVFTAVGEGAFPLAVAMSNPTTPDTSVPYYVISLNNGFIYAVPERLGHYNYSGIQFLAGVPANMKIPGVSFQTQVAP